MSPHLPERTRRDVLVTSAAAGLATVALADAADAVPAGGASSIRPFRARAPQQTIDDLRRRIAATRWPDKETVSDASQGVQLANLQEVLRYWGTDYDWRRAEARLNRHPQFLTEIDGVDIHFLHVRSRHPDATPLILTHGWPGSVFEFEKTIAPLTDPTAYGGRSEDAFHVVIPSLPGYGFSGRPATTGWDSDRIARAWSELMRRLGYAHYVAQGGDKGASVTQAMGRLAFPGLRAIHVNLPATTPPEVDATLATGRAPPRLSDQERAVFDALVAFGRQGNTGYFAMMTTRPQTIGYSLADSPAGLAAFVLVHSGFSGWRIGDAQKPVDEVLDDVTLYWLTDTGAAAARLYWEAHGAAPTSASAQRTSEIVVPVAVTVFPHEIYRAPESWARRAYPRLYYFNEVERGGHFAAWEEPLLFSQEMRAAFRSIPGSA